MRNLIVLGYCFIQMVHDVNQVRHAGFDPEHPRISDGRREPKTWMIGLSGLSWHDDNAV